ncbi:NUMOD4 motif-containing HNH endonuclease [Microbacterium sp. No. 7]|uniref:NUMOD4 motif-containing HNH endonuclease n=1 Tax=Microbacterium sp. No. 7 TaxID=1714373 RepID=UPI0006ECE68B|nr:NUMOD4 motif-containing HNH endonuclease [Microbacterium sp. No. 7]ALJ19573.1 hypothetical protein AOA12_06480 [Microbacterium sp. No. 7]
MSTDFILAEEWRPVRGFEGRYEVSSVGRIRSLPRVVTRRDGVTSKVNGGIRRPSVKKSGYLKVSLWRDNSEFTAHVHSLVLEAFVGPRPPGLVACHGDGNPANNRVENLRWDTPSENNFDRGRHGTDHKRNRTHCPRGHGLIWPNLVNGKVLRGHRNCKACSRERARSHAKKVPFSLALANDQYQRIMSSASKGEAAA